MTIACAPPDGDLGIAIRLSGWLGCTARALGENGFQSFVGGPFATGLLSGLVTIFVALIGYGMVLGRTPSLRDGIGWAVRFGIVLALVTGWSAFQTLVYRIAVDAPSEVAAVLLPSVGLPGDDVETRVQLAYDTIRIGSLRTAAERTDPDPSADAEAARRQVAGPPPLRTINPATPAQPQIASLFAVATVGVLGATRLATGFLLAVAPLAILAMLFDATLGLFSGWLRALAGAALAQLAALVVSAVGLLAVEGELGHLQAAEVGAAAPTTVDPQALTTIVLFIGTAMAAALLASGRMAGAIRPPPIVRIEAAADRRQNSQTGFLADSQPVPASNFGLAANVATTGERSRADAVADAIAVAVRREQVSHRRDGSVSYPGSIAADGRSSHGDGTRGIEASASALGAVGRRTTPRRSRSGGRRDERR